jgi:ABC-2 type transport system ATP-binding protein
MTKSDAQQRATTLMEQLELGTHLKSKLTALSKGMAQKVQFIATILHRPEIIIIDEPFSGLDPVNVQLLKDMLYTSAHEDGVAIIMSTHQMHQIQEMADRMLMIAQGKRVLYGAVDDVRRQYAQNRIVVAGEGDWQSLPGVTQVENHTHKATEKILYLDTQTTPEQVMQAMATRNYHIRHFEIEIPDLEEVFIRVVGGEIKS